jgi:hypothetical protein
MGTLDSFGKIKPRDYQLDERGKDINISEVKY